MKMYGNPPVKIASDVIVDNSEMYFYQYLPVKLVDQDSDFILPDRLKKLEDILIHCCNDFFHSFCLGSQSIYNSHYIYLTAKCLFVGSGTNLNRRGWHSDGFGTEDINYIWSDCVPTEYIIGNYTDVPTDDLESLSYFEDLGTNEMLDLNTLRVDENSIYRLDETVIHSPGSYIGNPVLRHFVKVSFSKEKYNLKGNSHNYMLDYEWDMKERSSIRNHPTK